MIKRSVAAGRSSSDGASNGDSSTQASSTKKVDNSSAPFVVGGIALFIGVLLLVVGFWPPIANMVTVRERESARAAQT